MFIRLRKLTKFTRIGEHRKSQDLLGPPSSRGNLQLPSCLSCEKKKVFLRPLSCWVGLWGMKPPQVPFYLCSGRNSNERQTAVGVFASIIRRQKPISGKEMLDSYQHNLYAIHQTLSLWLYLPEASQPRICFSCHRTPFYIHTAKS